MYTIIKGVYNVAGVVVAAGCVIDMELYCFGWE